jgi:hypothetical protein
MTNDNNLLLMIVEVSSEMKQEGRRTRKERDIKGTSINLIFSMHYSASNWWHWHYNAAPNCHYTLN